MKSPDSKFHAKVVAIVRKHWPRLVAVELMKLSGSITSKPEPKPAPEPTPEPVVPAVPPALKKVRAAKARALPAGSPQHYIDALATHGSKMAAARALGIAESTFRDRYKAAITATKSDEALAS